MIPLIDRIREIISEVLIVAQSNIKNDSTLDSLGADSLDHTEISLCLSEELGVSIEDGEINGKSTPETIETLINSKNV